MFCHSKLATFLLIWTIGMFPGLAVACAGPTMLTCHPCCGQEKALKSAVTATGVMSPKPCCAVSSGNPAPRSESQITSGPADLTKPVAVSACLEMPPQCSVAAEDRYPVATHGPAQSSLCTFLI